MSKGLFGLCMLIVLLAGCAAPALYQPYTLRHPGSGTTVVCGHAVWWECLVFDYEKYGFQRLPETP